MLVAKRTEELAAGTRGPVYREALKLQKEGHKVLKINTGNPATFGFVLPESLKKAMSEAMEKAAAYSDTAGIIEARKAILEYDLSKGFKNITEDDIFLGNGVSELAEMICNAIIDIDDEVLCPMPNYNLWTNSIILSEGKPVFYECFEDNHWMPTAEDIESHITEKTKAIVIINPNNPTGVLYTKELLLSICDIARRHKLVILSDEIYDRLLMDGKEHISIAALAPDIPVITFNGLSKSHIVCGVRCGWLTMTGFNEEDGKALHTALDTLSSIRLCSNTMAQFCVPAALKDPAYTMEMLTEGGRLFEQRNACIDAVNSSRNMSVVKNDGALYCFVRINPDKVTIKDDKKFALDLVRAKHILIVPGSGFDYVKPNYFRIVMLPEKEELVKAVKDIDDFLDSYTQD